MTKRKSSPASASAPTKKPSPPKPLTPLQPVGERVGEPRGNLKAREDAFKKRRRGRPGFDPPEK